MPKTTKAEKVESLATQLAKSPKITVDTLLELILMLRSYKGGEKIPFRVEYKGNVAEGNIYREAK